MKKHIYNMFMVVLLVCSAISFFMITALFQIKYVFGNDYLIIMVNSAIYLFWFYLGYYLKDLFGNKQKGDNNNGNE
jgi:hypothetical protein